MNSQKLPLSGVLLVSDVDGTLISRSGEIPRRNVEAIARFTQKGGLFTLATGRIGRAAARYALQAGANVPGIICNGAGLYDFAADDLKWSAYLPEHAKEVFAQACAAFPDIGTEIYADEEILLINENDLTEKHVEYEQLHVSVTDLDHTPEKWNKTLFAAPNARLKELAAFVEERVSGGWFSLFSNEMYYEMLPEGVTKGTAVTRLAGLLGVEHDKIAAIGDYYNDVELLRTAAVTAVPSGAPDDLKAEADYVVGRCEEGAVADFIEALEERFGCRE